MDLGNNAPKNIREDNSRPSVFTRKIYETDAEQKKDFWRGVGLWWGLNILLTLCQWGVGFGLFTVSPDFISSDSASSPLFTIAGWIFALLPWAINIGLILYFAFTRSQIALGMLAGFGIALAITICLGVIFTVWCFYSLGNTNF
jgi:hypothetical protein